MSDLKFIKIFVPLVLGGGFSIPLRGNSVENNCPNILFIITDDQSFPYCSAYGSAFVNTPAFDFIAKQGCLFQNAYVTSPGSSPSRASILSGMGQLHAVVFPAGYRCQFSGLVSEFPDYWSSDLCNFHIICADGSVCNELHAVSGT